MSDQMPDVAVCRQKPVVTKISDDYYVVVYHRDIPLSIAFAESIKNTNRLLSGGLKAAEENQSRSGHPIAVKSRVAVCFHHEGREVTRRYIQSRARSKRLRLYVAH